MKPRASNPFRPHLFTLAALLAAPFAHAVDGTWNGISGNWTDITNPGGVWSGGIIADGADFNANFTGIDIAADLSIALNGNRTIGNITFTDAATPSNNLAITGNTLTLDRTTGVPVIDVTQAGRTLSISSIVAGTDGLQKNGAGNLTLSALNTFTGPLNINGGNLEFSNNNAGTRNVFGSTEININNGATLRVSGSAGNIELYNGRTFTFDSGGGGSILVGTGNYNANTLGFSIITNGGARNNIGLISTSGAFGLNLGTNQLGTLNVALGTDATSDLTITPIIANAGSILKSGTGRLTLTGANTYSGTTTISAGTLIVNASNGLGNASATNTLIFTGGTLQAGGTINSGANRKVTLTSTGIINTNGNTVTISGVISGTGGLTKNGTGDLNLGGTNTYNGNTTISAGRLAVTAAAHLSSGATSISQSGTGQLFINSAVTISNPFDISTTGFLEPGDSQNNVNGAIRMNGSTLSGPVTLSGNSRIGAVQTVAGAQTNTISGKITGAHGIDFYGMQTTANASEVFILSNTGNDYTGTTTIYNSNYNTTNISGVSTTLRLGASNVIPDGANAGNVAFAINGTNNNAVVALDLNGFNETINGLTVNAGTFTKRITNTAAAANSVLTIGANDTTSSFSGTITDSGAGRTLAITKAGAGDLTLSSTSNYIGGTIIDGGTLTLGHATDTLANGGAVNVNGGTLALGTNTDTVGSVTLTSGSITGSGAGKLTGTGSAFDVRSGTISAKLGGTVGLNKSTAGTVTISSDNSVGGYTGATNVINGKLIINGNISTSSLTTIGAAGTLEGSGTVGKTIVNGTLAVGNSPGQMNFTDTLGLNGSTVMEIDGTLGAGVTGGHDFVNLTGAGAAGVLTYGGTMTLDMGVVFTIGTYSWNLFDMASETGTFTSISLADQYLGNLLDADLNGVWDLTSGSNTWQFTESTGVLGLTVVPEPRAALLGGLGLIMLLRRRRA